MRSLRGLLYVVAISLGMFVVVSPFLGGLIDTADQIRQGTSSKNARIAESQGGGSSADSLVRTQAAGAITSNMLTGRAIGVAGACLAALWAITTTSRKMHERRALAHRSRPPSTTKAAPPSYSNNERSPLPVQQSGITMENLERIETLGAVGLLVIPVVEEPVVATSRRRR